MLVGRPREGFSPAEAIAVALSLAATSVLLAILVMDVRLAGRLTVENGPVEWTQVTLFLVAGLLRVRGALRCAAERRPVAPDVVLVAGFAMLVIGEVDLDRILFGVKVIHTGFFVNPSVWWLYRVLAVVGVVGPPVVLAIFALRHRHELLRVLWSCPRTGWGRLYLTGGGLVIFVEAFERHFYSGIVPKYFIEECLELISAVLLLTASVAQPLAAGLDEVSTGEVDV
jgi:hypothetical protein